jgi:hypothetical protein
MMEKIRIFAKPNLTHLYVQQIALVLAKRFAQHKPLFSPILAYFRQRIEEGISVRG